MWLSVGVTLLVGVAGMSSVASSIFALPNIPVSQDILKTKKKERKKKELNTSGKYILMSKIKTISFPSQSAKVHSFSCPQ